MGTVVGRAYHLWGDLRLVILCCSNCPSARSSVYGTISGRFHFAVTAARNFRTGKLPCYRTRRAVISPLWNRLCLKNSCVGRAPLNHELGHSVHSTVEEHFAPLLASSLPFYATSASLR